MKRWLAALIAATALAAPACDRVVDLTPAHDAAPDLDAGAGASDAAGAGDDGGTGDDGGNGDAVGLASEGGAPVDAP